MLDAIRHFRPLSIHERIKRHTPPINVNEVHEESLSPVDRVALTITTRVGTMGFFFLISGWTVLWCGYNILASEVPALHWKAFDPFPAFVAYLLISNVIQILLMPLIMVGQNLQGRHSELRAENDFQVNVKAEQEIETVLRHLEFQNAVLVTMLEKLGLSADDAVSALKAHGISPTTGVTFPTSGETRPGGATGGAAV